MRRALTSAIAISSLVFSLGACTPRPDVADAAAASFLEALAGHQDAATQTDNPTAAGDVIKKTWDSLQAEGLSTQLQDVHTNGDVATAKYHMKWDLPGDRELDYDSQMVLTKSGEAWSVRWQPSLLHPELGTNQHLELRTVPAKIASVVGSDGAVLLKPGTKWRVFVDTTTTDDVGAVMRRIGAELDGVRGQLPDVPEFDVDEKTKEAQAVDGEFSALILNAEQGSKLKDVLNNIKGVRMNEEAALVRPDPGFAPDIMARVSGLVEKDLQGKNGWKVVVATAEGAEVRDVATQEASAAPSVNISLSHKVQQAAQEAVNTRKDAQAMMVVMRPSTGEILAVAQTPKADEKGDVALMGQYPPGSTFKMLTAYAGMDKKGLNPDSIVGCPGTQDIGGRIVTNYNSFSLGDTPLENAFAKSCNTTFADISTKLKPGELQDYAKKFGLGVDFQIDGLDTITGSVPKGEVMLDRTEAGYGQGHDLASPFGMAMVAATAAVGKRPTPYLIAGKDHKTDSKNQSADDLNPKTVKELRRLMRAVVTNGSGSAISGAGEVYAKTGEAEINEGSHAWFAGYRGDLAFATLVVLGGGSEHAVAVTDTFFKNLDGAKPEAPRPEQ
ncbi:penicillin-binding transpeptidase domain-containing protein [Corynebacterium auriscanis]|uniref:penicillin-binding transpeptidase domain-containing protein n=1 Tax=Corynebacterium auriscanis TaxID=99807 RepID=UPI003CF41121